MHLVAIVWRFPPRLGSCPQRERRLAPQRLPAEYARAPIPGRMLVTHGPDSWPLSQATTQKKGIWDQVLDQP
jgi:hypothetical protein